MLSFLFMKGSDTLIYLLGLLGDFSKETYMKLFTLG